MEQEQNKPQVATDSPQPATQHQAALEADKKTKRPLWKRWWFWLCVIIVLAAIGSSGNEGATNTTSTGKTSETTANSTETSTPTPAAVESKQPSVPAEYKSALAQATSYANTMHMSKQGVYDQLVSEYGGKFSAEAAQYAVDNVKADWNANALAKAKTYQEKMNQSPAAIHDQLTSQYGEKFTKAEADYAIQHLND